MPSWNPFFKWWEINKIERNIFMCFVMAIIRISLFLWLVVSESVVLKIVWYHCVNYRVFLWVLIYVPFSTEGSSKNDRSNERRPFFLSFMWWTATNTKWIYVFGGRHRAISSNALSFSCIDFWIICHYGRSIGANGWMDTSEKDIRYTRSEDKMNERFVHQLVKNDKTM